MFAGIGLVAAASVNVRGLTGLFLFNPSIKRRVIFKKVGGNGFYVPSTAVYHAIVWSVPEPTGLIWLGGASVAIGRRRGRRLR